MVEYADQPCPECSFTTDHDLGCPNRAMMHLDGAWGIRVGRLHLWWGASRWEWGELGLWTIVRQWEFAIVLGLLFAVIDLSVSWED